MALDDRPISTVEDRGFRYLINNLRPKQANTKEAIFLEFHLSHVTWEACLKLTQISFTTNTWTSNATDCSVGGQRFTATMSSSVKKSSFLLVWPVNYVL